MATRYKITFQTCDYVKSTGDYKRFDYTVCTLLDERKALVMATQAHLTQRPDSRIYQAVGIEKLGGTEAQNTDLDDRMEY